ncbi:MAG: class I SAM-dependent methyltransferase [Anaerolineaceae bacterium]|nr:class I SAM-dependent methyltransferase [Anaerolineaceae bacterium]
MEETFKVYLKSGREKSIFRRHPWVFSGAIDKVEGEPESGDTVEVLSSDGDNLGWGAFSPLSKIKVRMWSFEEFEEIDETFIRQKLNNAIGMRDKLVSKKEGNALRLVHAESDGLPGLVVDRYGDVLVMQVLSAGIEVRRKMIVDLLLEITGASAIYERSDVEVRSLEGLQMRSELLAGELPAENVVITEHDLKFEVDVVHGHKTGFYLDQRNNRLAFQKNVKDAVVLNCFSFTGAFAVYALAGGAEKVVSIDTSGDAIEGGKRNLILNGLDEEKAEWIEGDVFKELRKMRDSRQQFDVIVLDPPKFAPTASLAQKAARGYKDINLLAFKLLKPGGLLYTFSCSGGISFELFQQIVAGAALDARCDAQVVGHLFQGPDHPVAVNFPEGKYLKGLVCYKSS